MGALSRSLRRAANKRFASQPIEIQHGLGVDGGYAVVEQVCQTRNANFDAWYASTGGRRKWYESDITDPESRHYIVEKDLDAGEFYVSIGADPDSIRRQKPGSTSRNIAYWLCRVTNIDDTDGRTNCSIQLLAWVDGHDGKFEMREEFEGLINDLRAALAAGNGKGHQP